MKIPGFEKYINIEPISKGWSEDKKYCVSMADGTRYLLRISPFERHDSRKALFEMLRQVSELGFPMCNPVEFGSCEDGVYTLHSWIDGDDLEAVLPVLSETEQYVLGLRSGEILQKIHSIPAPKTQENWESRFNRKVDSKIKIHNNCPIKLNGAEYMIRYINENRYLLTGRPQCFQHGDYHVGNMMLENGELVIIDFDRFDFGDPWEEFNRIVWCAQASPYFATGMVDGYFNGKPPMEFWRLLALYISSNMLSSVSWAIPFGQDEIDTMLNQAKDVLKWYDNMQNPVPAWYLKGCELWDIYNADRQLTGQTILRSDAKNIKDGNFHLAAFMYIIRPDGKFLITKRSPEKKTYPNMWEIPHGAVLSGESSLDAAIREAFEECGIVLQRDNAEFLTEYRGGNLISDKWLFRQDFDLADIVLQDGETCDARACTPDEILDLIEKGEMQEYIYDDVKSFIENERQ